MGKKLLVLHGPNLNLLVPDLDATVKARASALGLELTVVQSNHEGVLLDTLHAERTRVQGVVVSPAGLFGSYPLRDGLEAVGLPALEVYVSALGERESVVAEACAATLEGEGAEAYLEALERFASGDLTGEQSDEDEADEDEDVEDDEAEEDDEAPVKTLGRRSAPATSGAGAGMTGSRKTLGRKVVAPPAPAAAPTKTLGRKVKDKDPDAREAPASHVVSRALVRHKIAERLAGRLTPAELAAWSRTQWLEVQRGGPAESGHRELLEDFLQRLTLSNVATSRLSDRELVDLMARLDR